MSYLSVIWPLYFAYLILTIVPLTIVLLNGDSDPERAIGVYLIAMAVFVFVMSGRYHQTLIDSLTLSYENEALAAASNSSAEAFRSLFDAAPVPLMLLRRSNGEVTRANSMACSMVESAGGYPGESRVIDSLFSSVIGAIAVGRSWIPVESHRAPSRSGM
jgi:PAS domain-containing protein